MAERFAFDTNIYFYSLDSSTGDKHVIARDLLHRSPRAQVVVLLQVLGELANALSKRGSALSDLSARFIDEGANVAVPTHADDLRLAIRVQKQHGMQFWDAVIWAAAKRSGCTILFTEDYQHGRIVEGVKILNPFQLSPIELDALLG